MVWYVHLNEQANCLWPSAQKPVCHVEERRRERNGGQGSSLYTLGHNQPLMTDPTLNHMTRKTEEGHHSEPVVANLTLKTYLYMQLTGAMKKNLINPKDNVGDIYQY